MKFKGRSLNVLLKCSGPDRLQVVLDGEPTSVLVMSVDQSLYGVVSRLADREHTVELFKRTEPSVGQIQLLGFQLEEGGNLLPLPARPDRRVEFIGDSITCGAGNEGHYRKEHCGPANGNNYLAYGAMAARDLGAEYVAVAESGKCLLGAHAIPLLYGRALPGDPESTWDLTSWIPHAVVINLGTNDFNRETPSEKEWREAYSAFIETIRKRAPQSHIFCAVGSMMTDLYPPGQNALTTIRRYTTGMVDAMRHRGDERVHYVEFDPQDRKKNDGGSDSHPSVKTHRLMADRLAPILKKELGW